jgi:hypothetical protein
MMSSSLIDVIVYVLGFTGYNEHGGASSVGHALTHQDWLGWLGTPWHIKAGWVGWARPDTSGLAGLVGHALTHQGWLGWLGTP